MEKWRVLRHSFTHFDLDIEPVVVRLDGESRRVAIGAHDGDQMRWFAMHDAHRIGIAAPIAKLLDNLREADEHDGSNGQLRNPG
jgi:A/G-specific adenine glycosylase